MSKKQPEIGKYQFTKNDQKYLEDYLKEAEKREWDRVQKADRRPFTPGDLQDLLNQIDELKRGSDKYKMIYNEYEEEQDRLAREYEQNKSNFKRALKRRGT